MKYNLEKPFQVTKNVVVQLKVGCRICDLCDCLDLPLIVDTPMPAGFNMNLILLLNELVEMMINTTTRFQAFSTK